MKDLKKGKRRLLSWLMTVAIIVVSVPQASLYVRAAEVNESTEEMESKAEGLEIKETDGTEAVSESLETEETNGTETVSESLETEETNGTEAVSEGLETEETDGTEAVSKDSEEEETEVSDGTEPPSDEQEMEKTTEEPAISNDTADAENGRTIITQQYCKDSNVQWTLYSDGELIVEGEGGFLIPVGAGSGWESPWCDDQYRNKITSATVRVTGATSAASMFENCTNLKTVDLTGFDTEKVTNMDNMFRYCRSLTDVDVSGFKTENVTNMRGMFSYCESLTQLDLSNFNTMNVDCMMYLIYECFSLIEVDVSSFDITNATDLRYMFAGCDSLKELDLSNFAFKSGQDIEGLLAGCSGLRKIITPKEIDCYWGISLPTLSGAHSWRLQDGTRISTMEKEHAGGIVLSADTYIGIRFEGTNFKLAEYSDTNIEDVEKVFEKGAKDSFTFTILPDEGYDVTPTVVSKTALTQIMISQGDTPYQYIVTPKDAEQGYIHDEVISIKVARSEIISLEMGMNDSRIQDYFVVSNGKKLSETDSTVPVSNQYDTTVYVKVADENSDRRIMPGLFLDWTDENGGRTKSILGEKDAENLTEEEKEFARGEYYVFRLGRVYEKTRVYISVDNANFITVTAAGFPAGFRIVRYVEDDFGGFQEQECKEKNLVYDWSNFYIQAKWTDTQNAHKWCQCQVFFKRSDEQSGDYQLCDSTTLTGIEGKVWNVGTWEDRDVLVELTPLTVGLGYHEGDIIDLAASEGTEISEDKKRIEIHSGDSVSLNVTLDEALILKGISLEGEGEKALENKGIVVFKEEGDGKWIITINDISKLYDVKKMNLDIEDSLQRTSLSDPDNEVSVSLSFDGKKGSAYNGKPIHAKQVRVFVNGNQLNGGTDYKLVYSNNVNAGQAFVTVMAMPDSAYRGQYVKKFTIDQAEAFRVPPVRLNVEAETPFIDLAEKLVLNGTYDQNVKPTGYEIAGKTQMGGIFGSEPGFDGSVLVCDIREDANRNSAPAKVWVNLYFENYKQTRVELNVYLVKREMLMLGGVLAADKIYDGKAYLPNPNGLQVLAKEGSSLSETEAGKILDSISGSMSYHYIGVDGTVYDSPIPPVEIGSYKLLAKVSEENTYYKSEFFDAGTFKITQREAVFTAEDVTLCIGDSLQGQYSYETEGLVDGDHAKPEPLLNCAIQNTEKIGEYPIQINVSGIRIVNAAGNDVTANYHISGRDGTFRIEEPKLGSYTVIYNLSGKGTDIRRAGMTAGSLIPKPLDPKADGYIFLGWYLDETFGKMWDFDIDTIQNDITLYAGWSKEIAPDNGMELYVQEILPQTYTGKAIKPVITVYAADGRTLLKKNKDYKIEYKNNIDADTKKFSGKNIPAGGVGASITDTSQGFDSGLAYAVITGKGNYTGTVYVNFHITPVDISKVDNAASGITLKYTEAFEEKSGKNAAIVTQFKTKTAKLKFGTDYTLTVKKTVDGTPVTLNSKGQLPLNSGTYTVTIDGKDNYTGSIERELYVASKTRLIKNAKVKCTGTISDVTKEQLAAGIEPQNLEVSINGSPLTKDKDYTVKCTNNNAIGTATVTVKGIGDYFGSKSITFKIKGIAFKEKEFGMVSIQDMTYTGTALTQNDVLLTKNGTNLIYGEDYTISYKNNIKKGKATMVFTAKPSSGYSGSFKKTFMIKPMSLDSESILLRGAEKEEGSSKWKLTESVRYQKGGAMPSGQLKLQLGTKGASLMAGKDYTIKYNDNQEVSNGKAYMTLTGKGNFTGSITVYFDIRKASLSELYQKQEMTVTSKAMRVTFSYSRYRESREDDWEYELKDPDYEFKPAITIKDGKKTLVKDVDYKVTYKNNVREQLEYGGTPQAIITGIGNYSGTIGEEDQSFTIPLSIYQYSLSGSRVYVVYDENTDYTYTGEPIKPKVTVYYGSASDIKKAKANGETDESTLTEEKLESEPGEPPAEYAYGLTKLQEYVEGKGGDYVLSYGANTAKGKNGKVIIRGVYNYSGNVTSKFTINPKEIYSIYEPEE